MWPKLLQSALAPLGSNSALLLDASARLLYKGPVSNYYDTLGVTRRATRDEITSAYKALVAKYHPDRHVDNALQELAEEKLKEANEAYQTLSNPQKRRLYDAGMSGHSGPSLQGQQLNIPPRTLLKSVLVTGAWLIAVPLAFRLSHNPKLFSVILGALFIWRMWRRRKKYNGGDAP